MRCPACGRWDDDGCAAPAACEKKVQEMEAVAEAAVDAAEEEWRKVQEDDPVEGIYDWLEYTRKEK